MCFGSQPTSAYIQVSLGNMLTLFFNCNFFDFITLTPAHCQMIREIENVTTLGQLSPGTKVGTST